MTVKTENLKINTSNGIMEVQHQKDGMGPTEPERSEYQRHRFNEGIMTIQAGGGQLKAQEQGTMEVKADAPTGQNFELMTRHGRPVKDFGEVDDKTLISIQGSPMELGVAKRLGWVTDETIKESLNRGSLQGQMQNPTDSRKATENTPAPAQRQTERTGENKSEILSLETPEISNTLNGIAQKHGRQATHGILAKMAGRIARDDNYESASKVLVDLGGYEPGQARQMAETMHAGYVNNFGKLLESRGENLEALEEWWAQQSDRFRGSLMTMVALGQGHRAADELVKSYRLKNRM